MKHKLYHLETAAEDEARLQKSEQVMVRSERVLKLKILPSIH